MSAAIEGVTISPAGEVSDVVIDGGPGDRLRQMQQMVGGFIEQTTVSSAAGTTVCFISDGEAAFSDKPINEPADALLRQWLSADDRVLLGRLRGTVLVIGGPDDDGESLSLPAGERAVAREFVAGWTR